MKEVGQEQRPYWLLLHKQVHDKRDLLHAYLHQARLLASEVNLLNFQVK